MQGEHASQQCLRKRRQAPPLEFHLSLKQSKGTPSFIMFRALSKEFSSDTAVTANSCIIVWAVLSYEYGKLAQFLSATCLGCCGLAEVGLLAPGWIVGPRKMGFVGAYGCWWYYEFILQKVKATSCLRRRTSLRVYWAFFRQ